VKINQNISYTDNFYLTLGETRMNYFIGSLMIFGVLIMWYGKKVTDDCESSGGISVKTSKGYSCLDKKHLK